MRVNPNLYTMVDSAIQQNEQSLQTAVSQLSSGKRVASPSDDPLAFSADIRVQSEQSNVDRYTKNSDAMISQAQMADSALSNVTTLLTKAITLGTEGGNGTVTDDQRSALAYQVQGLLANVVSQANASDGGVALFAGTSSTSTPFVQDAASPSGYTYTGNSGTNTSEVGDALSLTVNVPGNEVFSSSDGDVLGSMQQLVSALKSGSTSDIADATSSITGAIQHIGQVRAFYGNAVTQLNANNDYLSQESVLLTSQDTSLTQVDTATAATNLTQAQTAQNAVLAMAAKILPTSLLNYLQN